MSPRLEQRIANYGGGFGLPLTDLIGNIDIAEMAGGRRRQVVEQWLLRDHDCPMPVHRVNRGRTPLYSRPEVLAWLKRHGRLPNESDQG